VDQAHERVADLGAMGRLEEQRIPAMPDGTVLILPMSGKKLKSSIAGIRYTGVGFGSWSARNAPLVMSSGLRLRPA
jgi:hypothetical protein